MHQASDIRRIEAGHLFRVEPFKCPSEILPLPKYGEPAQTGLEALQDQHFENSLIIVQGNAPLFIMIPNVKRIALAPPTPLLLFAHVVNLVCESRRVNKCVQM